MKTRHKLLIALLALLVLLPTAALYFIASTERGLQFVVRQLDGKVGPVTLTPGRVTGTFVDGFEIESLRVQHRLSDTFVEGVRGRLELWPLLLRRHIHLPELTVRHLAIRQLRAEPRPQGTPRFLPPGLRIDADEIRIDRAEFTLSGGKLLEASAVSGAVTILHRQIRIRGGGLDYEQMHLAADGRVLAARPYGLEGTLSGIWRMADQPDWKFAAGFDGDLDRLPYELDISEPLTAHVEGNGLTLNKGWRFEGDAVLEDLDLTEFGAGDALGILSGRLAVTLDEDGFTAKGPVLAPGLQAGPLQVDAQGQYADRRVTLGETSLLHRPSGSRATLRGTVDIVEDGPRLALGGNWSTLRWPLDAQEPAFTSPRGSFTLEGVQPWNVTAEGIVVAADLPPMPGRVAGRLDGEAFDIAQGSVELYGGTAQFRGEARWQPAESWRLEGHVAGLDPAQLRDDLPGRLDFDFSAAGSPFGEEGGIEFALAELSGRLRGQAASGSGRLTRAGGSQDWQFHGVDLTVGRARLQLDGGLGATRDLTFAIDADDLSLFDAEARGRLSARGRYAGTDEAPLLLFKARGTDFEWQGVRIAALDADVDVDLAEGGHTRGQVDMTDLGFGARTVRKATLDLAGNTGAQSITLDIDAAPLRTALTARGAVQDGLWRGSVENLIVTDGERLTLRQRESAPLAFNLRELELGQLCLAAEQARGCGNARLMPDGQWSTTFSAEEMPLRAFTAGLTQDIDYEGTINLGGALSGSPGALPIGKVTGELKDAELRHRLSNGRDERLSLGSGHVEASATTTGFAVEVALDAGDSGSIRGVLTGQRTPGDWREYPIDGSLDARTDGLALLDIYVGGIDKATGHLTTRVQIDGTLGTPELAGILQLREATIEIYQVNLALRELSLDARFDTTALDLNGSSRLGEGLARFNGRLAWRDARPYGNLHVEGERLRVVSVPEARIDASPKLDFKLDGRRIEATGEVLIPYARLEPADLTNAVLASSDEVIVGAPAIDPESRWTVVGDISLVLGEDVDIDSLGLKARLGGSVQVLMDEAGATRGRGELNIAEGKYAALGRLLDIERGRLIFNNGPVSDPGLDLRAQKVFPDVTAGVNVRGTLRDPQLTFYSEPAIPQSQIASLILAGGSLESLQGAQRGAAARNDLLAQGGAILAQRVGTQVGIDDVGIESDTNAETSLVLGKYLSPRLYISYGISLAEAINTLKLRYTIGDRWTIKTEAGKARSADIVYTLKK